ncbi:MAG: type II secretion system protein [Eubacterium aggregans]|uniref:Prepilin-type N-terminal cleavage/methylation domain-containing protein n=2 Tax=Eubacterium aggregans TaxID=81409 RepID=A0A1H4AHA1_9FIRM|nr:type II secretion system protein [Eubacterium aggregans]MEA5072558.1 type II secretion system protein [Eubacterium aggregans]SEA35121.1 prepilin-type N-terminal cleavage/methylation domain-containing protein [Eubacterium aggregans]
MEAVMRKLRENRGMTLIEVTVALVLFVFVFMILLYGINSALKVMGNAQAINNTTQSNVSKLESLGSSLEAEGAILTDLGDKLTIDGKAIAGTFKVATTKKSNDQTDLSLTLFQPKTPRNTPPLPSVMPTPVPSDDKIVVVPSYESKKAYYSPDEGKSFFSNSGEIQTWLFDHNPGWSAFYYERYGALRKGVTTQSYFTNQNSNNPPFEYLQQLFFINEEPFKFQGGGTGSGSYQFHLNFLYVGDNVKNTVTHVKFSLQTGDVNSRHYVSSLKIIPYDAGKPTIMYLPKPWELRADPEDITVYNPPNTPPTINPVELPAGFYEFPEGETVDILQAVYDEDKRNKILSYHKKFSEVQERLNELEITVQ